jgi:signal transduction histidine kinase/CheY-like chemotaxis protein
MNQAFKGPGLAPKTLVARIDRSEWNAWGIGLLSILLCLGLGLIWLQRGNTAMVERAIVVDERLATVLSSLQDAENGARGYELTGRKEFLDPYRAALARLEPDLSAVRSATADNPLQQAAINRVSVQAAKRMAQIAAAIALRDASGISSEPFIALLRQGRSTMEAARLEIIGMRAEEARLLIKRQQSADTTLLWSTVISIVGIFLAIGTNLVGLRDQSRRIALVSAGQDELLAANTALVSGNERTEDAESQVRQLQKMEAVGQLTGGIAHDFNNMLAIVIAGLDLARRQLRADPDKALARIDSALEGARRAATLTARLLAFSRQQALTPIALDPNRLVSGMSDLLRRTIGEQVQIEIVLGGGAWRVHADVAQLENAIINLCVNARDAMVDGGRLTIETSNAHLDDGYARLNGEVVPGQYVQIAVTDSGVGMPPGVVQRAFEPFFTTKGTGKGTGLGLSQVFGFIKQSGGHVKIYSEPGAGTSVKLYLPRWVGPDHAEAVTAAIPPPTPVSARGELVLVVEDDPDVRTVSIDALRYLGYAVLNAASAEEALDVMARHPRIDLLFTDIVMPGVTGRVLADLAVKAHPGLKVLYTTGYTRNAVVHNGVLDAGVDLLPKPFTVDQLGLKVREMLDR